MNIGDKTLPKAQLTRELSAFAKVTTWMTTTTTNNEQTLLGGWPKSSILSSIFYWLLQAVSCLQITATALPNSTMMSHFKRSYSSSHFFISTLWKGQTLDFFERDCRKRVHREGEGDVLLRNINHGKQFVEAKNVERETREGETSSLLRSSRAHRHKY